MKKLMILLLLIIINSLIQSCKEEKTGLTIHLNSKNKLDTLYISELLSKKVITKIYKDYKTKKIELEQPLLARIYTRNNVQEYLAILTKNKTLNIHINRDSTLITKNKGDSLLNYLWKSNLKFIRENSKFIFTTKNTDSIPLLFEKFRNTRQIEIDKYEKQLSKEIKDILYYQNDARIYSFLFWLGRVSKQLSTNDTYFNFVSNISSPDNTLKTLPDIYLYKYEIEYLRENTSIDSISDFLDFIEQETKNNDLADFLKANYIKALIETPSYWQKHKKLFNTNTLDKVLNDEKNNTYYYLIKQPSLSFYKSQNGETAYSFSAEDRFGNSFNLKNLKGKVVFIDVWATWCGACIHERPNVLELAEKYKNNDNVEFLLISVDSKKDKWLSFLKKENNHIGRNLFIENGMQKEFGKNYNIKTIPRYILIDKNGKIINSNIGEPSLSVEQEIEKALATK